MGKIILGIILLFFIIILCLPVGVEGTYQDTLYLWIRVSGIRIAILPKKNQKSKKKQAQAGRKESPAKQDDAEHKKSNFLEKIRSLKSTFELIRSLIGTFFRYSRKRIKIKKLAVFVEYGADDAAKTAISVGAIWSALYGLLPVLDHLFAVNKHQFQVEPIYHKAGFSARAEGIVMTRPVHIIVIGFVLGIRYLKFRINKKKAVKNHE